MLACTYGPQIRAGGSYLFISHAYSKPKGIMKQTLTWLAFGLLATLTVVFAALYWIEISPDADEPTARADEQAETETKTQTFSSDATSSTAVEKTEQRIPTVNYEANVGKFKLALDPIYRVVVELDGDDQSGRATKIQIAREKQEAPGVIEMPLTAYVKLEAYPSKTHGTRDEFITSDTTLQDTTSKESAGNVAGVKARKFTITGLGETVKYYFESSGTTFLIEAWDVKTGDTQAMLDAVLAGFTFN